MSIVSLIITIIALGAIIVIRQRRRPSHPYPPGPRGLPLIGNVADMPKDYVWLTFSRWGKIYGPLTYLNMMGQPVIVINDHKTAIDLLEKRGSIYSDRYRSVMAVELTGECSTPLYDRFGTDVMIGLDVAPVLQSYTPRLRSLRKLMHSTLSQNVVQRNVWPLQEKETRNYLNKLVDQPHAFLKDLLECVEFICSILTY